MQKNNSKWERIRAARELLDLDRRASLEEIKLAYRRKAKAHHPDLIGSGPERVAGGIEMHRLTEAYQTLTGYCFSYQIPLEPEPDNQLDDEEWWMQRFGSDPLWGKGRG
ncbi:MAG: J domain-containing protein [Desulfobulbaceae bacterium]|nr:J domain-containing protein [Desulfobulbaceae bacterium]